MCHLNSRNYRQYYDKCIISNFCCKIEKIRKVSTRCDSFEILNEVVLERLHGTNSSYRCHWFYWFKTCV